MTHAAPPLKGGGPVGNGASAEQGRATQYPDLFHRVAAYGRDAKGRPSLTPR